MIQKLRLKFVCINMTIVVLMLALVFSFVYVSTARNLEQAGLNILHDISENEVRTAGMGDHFMNGPGNPDKPKQDFFRPDNNRPDRKHMNRPYLLFRLNRDGNLISMSGMTDSMNSNATLAEKDYAELVNILRMQSRETGIIKDYSIRYLASPSDLGTNYICIDISQEQEALTHLLQNGLLAGLAAFFAFLLISIGLARWAVKPVQKAWDDQMQFVSDASHELKTPLTVITTNAELMTAPDCPEEDRLLYGNNILTMCRQMRGLVESLLDIARMDNGKGREAFQDTDLSALTEEALLPFEPLFFEQNLMLSAGIEPDIHIKGNPEHLTQLVGILLDNARKYSSPAGATRLTLKSAGKSRCVLEVANQGDAIPPEEREAIFKRFYRADKARTMNESYGLGLAIARQISEEHGGRITADSRNGENIFTVELQKN